MVVTCRLRFFVFKQKTAYELRISDWSSDVCSSDLLCCACFEIVDEPPVFMLALPNAAVVDFCYRPIGIFFLLAYKKGNFLRNPDDGCHWRLLSDRKSTRLNSSH